VNSEKNLTSSNLNTKNKSIIQIDMPEQKEILENLFLWPYWYLCIFPFGLMGSFWIYALL
jgi:hypothetical protein